MNIIFYTFFYKSALSLMLIQGPLMLDWRRRKLENACIQKSQPPSMARLCGLQPTGRSTNPSYLSRLLQLLPRRRRSPDPCDAPGADRPPGRAGHLVGSANRSWRQIASNQREVSQLDQTSGIDLHIQAVKVDEVPRETFAHSNVPHPAATGLRHTEFLGHHGGLAGRERLAWNDHDVDPCVPCDIKCHCCR